MDAPDIERSRKQPNRLSPNVLIEPHLSFSLTPGAAHSLFPKKRMGGAFLAPKRCPSHAGYGAGTHHKGPLPPAPIIHLPKDAFLCAQKQPSRLRGASHLYTVAALRFPGISCPPIAPHPRKRLACSATGGASPLSPILFFQKENAPRPVEEKKRGSLAPPLAALRRFPQPPGAAKSNSMR